tara:strand:- start:284783 stop:285253 length:471 start_codon:yes stop_codon:yes gene_type:complete
MQFQQKITPFLSYKDRAEEAVHFYVSVLPDSRIIQTIPYPHDGSVMTIDFELAGMRFVALNTGQPYEFTESFSLAVSCESQDEIDSLWEQLTADGGREVACGWLADKFGMFWQIVPSQLNQWFQKDPAALQRMFAALTQMTKLDTAALQKAVDGQE